ncbi:MAG: hypothetical protein O7J95_19285 [Planctomycetota bacterium]|nr:hypothetical protein [Planctomycetota bacterium]
MVLRVVLCSFTSPSNGQDLERPFCEATGEHSCDDRPMCECGDDNLEITFPGAPDDHVFEYTEFSPGMRITSVVSMSTVSPDVVGWSFGVRHDPSKLAISEADITLKGTTVGELCSSVGGCDFVASGLATDCSSPDGPPTGYIMAVILKIEGGVFLPPQRNTLLRATYTLVKDAGRDGTLLQVVDDVLCLPDSPPVTIGIGRSPTDGPITEVLPRRLTDGLIRRKGKALFLRGDANLDASIDLSDGITVLLFLFVDGRKLGCPDAADFDDSGELNATDAIGVFQFLFLDGDAPPPPGPIDCGEDASEDPLGCPVLSCP